MYHHSTDNCDPVRTALCPLRCTSPDRRSILCLGVSTAPASCMKPSSMGSLLWVRGTPPHLHPPAWKASFLLLSLNSPCPHPTPPPKSKSPESGGCWEAEGSLPKVAFSPSPSVTVRRLQLREELDRSSCGNVLFNGYLPPPGAHPRGGKEGDG